MGNWSASAELDQIEPKRFDLREHAVYRRLIHQ